MSTFVPALIMFTITVFVVTLFFVPPTVFKRPNKLVNFYWMGFWVFLGLITSITGAQNTLMLLGYNADALANSVLVSVILCFVFFVCFAWFRLSSAAIWHGMKKIRARMS